MSNTRFATLIHILTILAKNPDQWVNSTWIAASIGLNPVIVRKELLALQENGLVVSKKGKGGGSKLNKPCSEITMEDIYRVVRTTNALGKKNKCHDTDCPIGKNINRELGKLFQEVDEILSNTLRDWQLKKFVSEFD